MPFIEMKPAKATTEQKEKLVEGFTSVASEALGMPASAFYVLIQEMEIYRDADAYKRYVESPEYNSFLQKLSSIFISAQEIANRPAHIVLSTKGFH